jgi:hypothetical protein
MKKLVLVSLLLMTAFLTYQTVEAAEPSTQAGSKSLYFGLNGLSELSVDASTLGVQYLFVKRMGIWTEINLSLKTSSNQGTDVKTQGAGIGVGFIVYPIQKGPVALYATPMLGFNYLYSDATGSQSYSNVTTNSLYIGIGIGAEWWFYDGMSLSVSTFLGYDRASSTYENNSNKTSWDGLDENIGFTSSNQTKFLLSFYF